MKSGLDAPEGLARAPIGRRALWGMTLAVLALHLAVLSGLDTDGLLSPSTPPVQRPLQARALPTSPDPRPAAERPTPRQTARTPVAPHPPAAPHREAAPGGPAASAILPPSPLAEPLASTAAAEVASPMASLATHGMEPVASTSKAASTPGSPASAASAASPATAVQSAQGAVAPTPPAFMSASSPWPVRLGPLPPSSLTRYQLTGMDRGLTYYANGELRWQHGPDAYELSLVVKAFLIGSRQWQSIGQIGPQGLQPLKFIDKARQERAAHIDREGARIVFSGNTQSTEPQAGLQDQLSLYLQLATALSGELGQRPAGEALEVELRQQHPEPRRGVGLAQPLQSGLRDQLLADPANRPAIDRPMKTSAATTRHL